jgi:glutathionylspermidine synthase
MQRLVVAPRPQWEQRVEALGLLYHTQAAPYWFESAYYSFSSDEVDVLERATNELHARCIDAAQHIIENGRYDELSIPPRIIPLIEHSWETDQPSLYGRFDFSFDGSAAPKLLEYNADTPTSLLEAGIIQWFWREDVQLGADQFNSIHERLVLTWSELSPRLDRSRILYFASVDDREDEATITYLRDTAEESGIRTASILVSEIGWDDRRRRFVDLEFQPIGQIFKLYPWEWLAREEFADHLIESFESTIWIEPAWKMLLSNKGLLPILWELFPDHPNLLESHFEPGRLGEYARKPLLSREGANITLLSQAGLAISQGDYGGEGYIYQALAPLPVFDGMHAVIGSWVIGGEAAGIGVRESDGPITDNLSRFVPHVIGPVLASRTPS